MADRPKLLVYIDGGSKGNPGPAACAAVIKTADDGQTVLDRGEYLGEATNNVAEYEGLLLGLRLAADLKAGEIEVRSDSELLVRQLTGEYRVKNDRLKELHAEVRRRLDDFDGVQIRHVPREQNTEADRLVNETVRRHREGRTPAAPAKGHKPPPGTGGPFRLK